MTTIKAYTDLNQSKKLAEILPIETADMRYTPFGDTYPWVWKGDLLEIGATPCWSLAALIGILPNGTVLHKSDNGRYFIGGLLYDNLLDACYDRIIKLHEQKLL